MNTLISVWEANPTGFLFLSGAFAILFSMAYFHLAEDAVETIVAVRSWAYSSEVGRPERDDVDFLRTIWPVALAFNVLVYGVKGTINRVRRR
jgi:hypothetical protein